MPLNPLRNFKRPPRSKFLPANVLLRQREALRLSEQQEQVPMRARTVPLALSGSS
jgi:hypothetical protein